MFEFDGRLAQRIPAVLSALGLAVLCFLYGAASVSFEIFPYRYVFSPTFDAFATLERRSKGWGNAALDSHLWGPVTADERGVVAREDKALLGYTFYSSGHLAGGPLVDMRGRVVHRWNVPFRTVWSDPPHVDDPAPASNIYWEDVELTADGELLAIYAAAEERPSGYGLAKIGPDSTVLWRAPVRAHDDVSIAPDGSIRALTHRLADRDGRLASRLDDGEERPLVDEVVEFSKDGERLGRLSLANALLDSRHANLLDRAESGRPRGPLGASSVAVASDPFADEHEFVAPGQLVVALAGLEALVGIDPESGTVVWTRTGPWKNPRSLTLRPDGDVVLLDARGDGTGRSRVIRYAPGRKTVEWSYGDADNASLNVSRLGSQRVLSNGNILVTDPGSARIDEIVPGAGVVWSYVNPETAESDSTRYRPALFAADRIPRGRLEFPLNSR